MKKYDCYAEDIRVRNARDVANAKNAKEILLWQTATILELNWKQLVRTLPILGSQLSSKNYVAQVKSAQHFLYLWFEIAILEINNT
jgi:hypothetical protein